MKFDLRLSKRGMVLVGVPLLLELLFISGLVFAVENAESAIWRERHSRAVLSETNALFKSFLDTAIILYKYGTTKSEKDLEHFSLLQGQIPEQVSHLKALIRNSSNRAAAYKRIERIGNQGSEILARCSDVITDSWTAKRLQIRQKELGELLAALRAELRDFVKAEEESEKINPQAEANARLMVILWLVGGITVNVASAIAMAVYYNSGVVSGARE